MSTTDDALVVPAWLGPAKMWIPSKGRAFTFGLFAVEDENLLFASREEVLNISRREVHVTWPRLLAGGGCWLEWSGGKCSICFGKPFPDAPDPSESSLAEAADALEEISSLPMNDNAVLGLEILSDLLRFAVEVRNIKAGREVARDVQRALG